MGDAKRFDIGMLHKNSTSNLGAHLQLWRSLSTYSPELVSRSSEYRQPFDFLELNGFDCRCMLRLLGDDPNGLALFRADQFEATSDKVPPSWIVRLGIDGSFDLGPSVWNQPGFWERYYDGEAQARNTFIGEISKLSEVN